MTPPLAEGAIHIVALPRLDLRGRQLLTAPAGATIAQIVALALPCLVPSDRRCVRVTINNHEICAGLWNRVRPKPGTDVVIRVVPTGENFRSILSLVVTIAAVAVAGPLAGGLGFAAGSVGAAVVSLATVAAGALLVNAIVPLKTPRARDASQESPSYSISGFQNALGTGAAIPDILGEHRFAPPYAALPYTEISSNDQYLIALFNLGYGPYQISDVKLGDNLLGNFAGVEFEVREGYDTDPPVTLYAAQVIEQTVEASSAGDAGDAGTIATDAVVRTTPRDITEASIDITFPQGLVEYDGSGNPGNLTVNIRIRHRLAGSHIWDDVTTLTITAAERKPVRTTHRWALPERGQYEIEVTRLTAPFNTLSKIGTSVWSALRGFRPEYPISFDKPLGLIAVKIKATGQLNGVINNLSALVKRVCLDWDRGSHTWVLRPSRNPASLYRYVLQANSNAFPKEDAEISLAALAEWHEYCDDNGLEYNRVHDFSGPLWDVLTDVAAAGRATVYDNGTTWSVIVDRPKTVVIAHLSPRNSWGFSGERVYFRPPDAFRVSFLDETQGFQQVEQVIPWPDFVGDPEVTEQVEFPGITHPTQIFREARRRQYELIHRRDRYFVNQDFEHLVLERGDLVRISHDVLDRTQVAARVKALPEDNAVVLDTPVTIEDGESYAVRFRKADGTTLLKTVQNPVAGETALLVVDEGEMPGVGDLALFGLASTESLELIVKDIERGDNLSAHLTLLDHAPEIEAAVNADALPDWADV